MASVATWVGVCRVEPIVDSTPGYAWAFAPTPVPCSSIEAKILLLASSISNLAEELPTATG